MASSGQALDRDEVKEMVQYALNADSNDEEHDALVNLAEMVGLELNTETEQWE